MKYDIKTTSDIVRQLEEINCNLAKIVNILESDSYIKNKTERNYVTERYPVPDFGKPKKFKNL